MCLQCRWHGHAMRRRRIAPPRRTPPQHPDGPSDGLAGRRSNPIYHRTARCANGIQGVSGSRLSQIPRAQSFRTIGGYTDTVIAPARGSVTGPVPRQKRVQALSPASDPVLGLDVCPGATASGHRPVRQIRGASRHRGGGAHGEKRSCRQRRLGPGTDHRVVARGEHPRRTKGVARVSRFRAAGLTLLFAGRSGWFFSADPVGGAAPPLR